LDNIRLSQVRENFRSTIQMLRKTAKEAKQNISLLYKLYKHPNTPWYAKAIIIITISYALSPIDLIPDFIPILGYLDDLVLVPAGIALSFKLIPKETIEECRKMLEVNEDIKHKGIFAAIIITIFWAWIIILLLRAFHLM
jgi:uncharacterized membrane protein YkvA (DUF1232 family)